MKTYGTVTYDAERHRWRIACEPHVSLRLKAVFTKIDTREFGELSLSATDANSRDLEWFGERFPLDMAFDVRARLTRRARAHNLRVDETTAILSGDYRPPSTIRMALPPRPYQVQAAELAWKLGGVLVADELGLGKTITGLTVLSDPAFLPAVIVCPAHLPTQWQREIERFLPDLSVHIVTKASPYPLDDPDIVIVNYHKLAGWAETLAERTTTVVFDECQELRREASLKYAAAAHLAQAAACRVGLSATPIYNYGEEFFNVFDVLAPTFLGSRQEFLREWCRDGYRADKASIREPKVFGSYLLDSGRMVMRTKADVGRELPALSAVPHEVSCDERALEEIENDATDLARIIVSQNAQGWAVLKASQEFSNKLRQVTGIAKAPYVAAFVRMLVEERAEKVLLFGWHREVYRIWARALQSFRPAWFTGSETPSKKRAELARFVNDDECRVMMMSLRSGSGVDGLQAVCSRVVFGELDWSPGVLEQCVGRVHRDGQAEPVFAYYLHADEGCDPVMLDVLGVKKAQLDGVRDPADTMVAADRVDPDHIKRLARAYLSERGKA